MNHPHPLWHTLAILCVLSSSGCQRNESSAPADARTLAQADSQQSGTQVTSREEWQRLYQRAIGVKDYRAAGTALLGLIDLNRGEEQTRWVIELARVYRMDQRYESCSVVCESLVASHEEGKSSEILEMQAISYEALGRKPEAMAIWAQLMKQQPTPVRAVRFACLLLDDKKIAEADEIVQSALVSPLLHRPDQVLKLPLEGGGAGDLPVEAALQNLLGLIAMNRTPSDPIASRAAFQKALEIAPSYIIARRNLEKANAGPTPPPEPAKPPEAETPMVSPR